MTLLKKLQSHVGGLVKIKAELYWYDSSSWENVQERICTLLDSALRENHDPSVQGRIIAASRRWRMGPRTDSIELQVLVDGLPCWILLDEENFEIVE